MARAVVAFIETCPLTSRPVVQLVVFYSGVRHFRSSILAREQWYTFCKRQKLHHHHRYGTHYNLPRLRVIVYRLKLGSLPADPSGPCRCSTREQVTLPVVVGDRSRVCVYVFKKDRCLSLYSVRVAAFNSRSHCDDYGPARPYQITVLAVDQTIKQPRLSYRTDEMDGSQAAPRIDTVRPRSLISATAGRTSTSHG